MNETLVAVVVGLVQGLLEWLPVSSEGGVAVATTLLFGTAPDVATRLGLFLHGGTALAALAYYRDEVGALGAALRDWRPGSAAVDDETADLSFLVLATLATAATGLPAYAALDAVVSTLTGGAFLALVGGLLLVTGLLQRFAASVALPRRERPGWVDALLVGALQGLAVLPGVSRSGTTVSALLLRGHDGDDSLRLSFLLSIPAALAANALVVVDRGVPAVGLEPALVALAVSAVVGYLAVGALVGLVRRVPFWTVCVGFGVLGVVGGVAAALTPGL